MNVNSRSFVAGLAAFLVVMLTAVYWNHFDNSFHFDDHHTIVTNGYIRDIGNIPLFFKDAKTTSSLPVNQAYRPLVTTLNAIDHWLVGKLDVKVFHWHIYLEFLLLLLLLYFLFRHVFELANGQQNRLLALLAAAFFGFHAATAETINYIIARSDGFSTLMVVFSILIHVKASGWKRQLALLPYMIGCLAKPTTLMVAPILFIYELVLIRPSFFVIDEKAKVIPKLLGALKGTLGFFVVGVGMYLFTRSLFAETWRPSDVAQGDYLNTQPYVFWIYIRTFFLPDRLTADTDLTIIKQALSPKVLWGLLVIFISAFLAFRSAKFRRSLPIAFGIAWFYIALIPSSSVVPLAEVMNHHRTFFPYIGLVMACFWAGQLLFDLVFKERPGQVGKAVVTFLLIGLFGAHAYGTYQRNEVWHSDESLWLDVTKKSPKNGRGLMNYGLAEMRNGNLEVAIRYFEKSMRSNYRAHPYLYVNMAIAKDALADELQDPALRIEAEKNLKRAIQLGPGYPDCHYHYARWLLKNDRSEEAFPYLTTALELSPEHELAKPMMAALLARSKADLKILEEQAFALNTPEGYLSLSLKYYYRGSYEDCIKACLLALKLKPDYAPAYNNICTAYNKMGRFEEGIRACEKALEIQPDFPLAKGNLDWAKKNLSQAQ